MQTRLVGVIFLVLGLGSYGRGQESVPPLGYPEFTDTTLSNGLRILVAEHHEQPAVFCQILVKAGARDEPLGKEGLASVTASQLDQGTDSFNSEEFAEAVDGIGGRLWTWADDEYTIVGCRMLAADIETGLGLLAGAVLKPVFPAKSLARQRKQEAADIAQERAEPMSLARRHAAYLLFGPGNRLGREVSEKSIGRIAVADVRGFHAGYYVPGNSILIAVGDFAREEMLALLCERFGGWTSRDSKPRPEFTPPKLRDIRCRLVNKPGLDQGYIAIAEWGIGRRDPDNDAHRIMDYVFGGGWASRLMTVVRVEQGKTYGVGSERSCHPDFGTYGVGTFTRTEEVASTCRLLVSEMRRLADSGVTDTELAGAKSYLVANLPLQMETPGQIAQRVAEGLYYGFTLDELRHETARLAAVKLEDVNRVAKQYLDPDAFVLVVVGDAGKLRVPLREIGRFDEVNWQAPLVR